MPLGTLNNGNRRGDPMTAPRCTAHSKRTGLPCRQPAVRGRPVCRMHGARAGGPKGERNGMWRHGCCDTELRDAKREARFAPRVDPATGFWRPQLALRLGDTLDAMSADERDRLDRDMAAGFERFRDGDRIRLHAHVRIGIGFV